MFKTVLSVLLCYAGSAFASTHTRQEIADHFREAGFSGAVGIFSPRESFTQAFGVEGGRLITASDHFLIGSVTKQFTAAAILKLLDQGRIDLNDPVVKYVTNFRDPAVTIHELLAQTSGVPEVIETPDFQNLIKQKFITLDPLIGLIVTLPMDFPAGSRWAYSNSNYILLAAIVQVISGENWWSFVKRELVDAAGMKDTDFGADRGPSLISGHEFDRDYGLVAISDAAYLERGWANGAGGIESTVKDLASWNSALYGGHLLSSHSLRLMTSAQAQVNAAISYGYGLFIAADQDSGETFYFHTGGIPGFTAYTSFYPQRNMSVVGVANYFANEPVDFARALAQLTIHGSTVLQSYVDDPNVPSFPMDLLAGDFASSEIPDTVNLEFANGKLYASFDGESQYRLVIRGEDWFYDRSTGLELKFTRGSADEFDLVAGGLTHQFKRATRRPIQNETSHSETSIETSRKSCSRLLSNFRL